MDGSAVAPGACRYLVVVQDWMAQIVDDDVRGHARIPLFAFYRVEWTIPALGGAVKADRIIASRSRIKLSVSAPFCGVGAASRRRESKK